MLDKSSSSNSNDGGGGGGGKKIESGVFITPNKILINGNMVMSGGWLFMHGIAFVTVKNVQWPTDFYSTQKTHSEHESKESTRGLTELYEYFSIILVGVAWLHSRSHAYTHRNRNTHSVCHWFLSNNNIYASSETDNIIIIWWVFEGFHPCGQQQQPYRIVWFAAFLLLAIVCVRLSIYTFWSDEEIKYQNMRGTFIGLCTRHACIERPAYRTKHKFIHTNVFP